MQFIYKKSLLLLVIFSTTHKQSMILPSPQERLVFFVTIPVLLSIQISSIAIIIFGKLNVYLRRSETCFIEEAQFAISNTIFFGSFPRCLNLNGWRKACMFDIFKPPGQFFRISQDAKIFSKIFMVDFHFWSNCTNISAWTARNASILADQ